ncbi:MAG: hypothetical protein ABIS01_14230 [Ferruginibacter sp.]
MKKLIVALGFFMLAAVNTKAQQNSLVNQFADLTGTIGSSQGALAGSYVHNWKLGKKKKLEAGLGLRVTGYFGTKKDFITAPARLARSSTVPFIIVFAGHEDQNVDTLTVQRPFTISTNITFNAGYHFNSRWYGGFNIDLIGFTVGRKSSAILTSNGITKTEPAAKPTPFNVLLTGDNDYGTLNSEFFLKYKISDKWSLKAVYQFLFVEYKTQSVKQTAPDGTLVDRFRLKANTLGAGVSISL